MGVAVCQSCDVLELLHVGFAVRISCRLWELPCVGSAVCGIPNVGELQLGEIAVYRGV